MLEKEFETQNDMCGIFFKPLGMINCKPTVKCKDCGESYVGGDSKYGTSSFSCHMGKCNGIKKLQNKKISPIIFDHLGKLRNIKLDCKVLSETITKAIIRHDLPFKFVEYEWIRDIFKYLNADVKFILRVTTSYYMRKVYVEQKKKLKENLSKIPGRICLTCVLWTSCTNKGYICLTTYYVDFNWKLKSKILAFCNICPPHSGVKLARKVMEIINDWGIDKKFFSLILDNTSTNDNMRMNLKTQLSLEGSLLCEGKFFHVQC